MPAAGRCRARGAGAGRGGGGRSPRDPPAPPGPGTRRRRQLGPGAALGAAAAGAQRGRGERSAGSVPCSPPAAGEGSARRRPPGQVRPLAVCGRDAAKRDAEPRARRGLPLTCGRRPEMQVGTGPARREEAAGGRRGRGAADPRARLVPDASVCGPEGAGGGAGGTGALPLLAARGTRPRFAGAAGIAVPEQPRGRAGLVGGRFVGSSPVSPAAERGAGAGGGVASVGSLRRERSAVCGVTLPGCAGPPSGVRDAAGERGMPLRGAVLVKQMFLRRDRQSSRSRCYSSEVDLAVSTGILLADEDPFPGNEHSGFPGSSHRVLTPVGWLPQPWHAVGRGPCAPGSTGEK